MIYLDNAATSRFKPERVLSAAYEAIKNGINPTRTTFSAASKQLNVIYATREMIRDHFGAKDHTVAFTSGCTESLNLAILGRNYKKGANVITTAYEHNAVLRPLYELQKRGVIKVIVAEPNEDGEVTADTIGALINESTDCVVVNAVSNVTGRAQPIREIGKACHEKNVDFILDMAQAAGHENINLSDCYVTAAAAPAHKALNGIVGCGFLIFDPEKAPAPIRFGGTGTDSFSLTQPTVIPEGLESGTLNYPAIVALYRALEWHVINETRYINRINSLGALLYRELSKIKDVRLFGNGNCGIVSMQTIIPSEEFADVLVKKGIVTRAGFHCAPLAHKALGTADTGMVRFSVGYDNTENEMIYTAKTVADICALFKK